MALRKSLLVNNALLIPAAPMVMPNLFRAAEINLLLHAAVFPGFALRDAFGFGEDVAGNSCTPFVTAVCMPVPMFVRMALDDITAAVAMPCPDVFAGRALGLCACGLAV
jgi:hypothetical protein